MRDGELFTAGDHRVVRLRTPDDVPAVAAVMERCADHAVMARGAPYRPEEDARAFLAAGPEGKEAADVLKLGVRGPSAGCDLDGLMGLVRGYPAEGTWYLGLLLLVPEHRGHGLGRAVARAFEAWAAGQGARRLVLSVPLENRRALRFWRGLGFEVTRKLPTRRVGAKDHVRLEMARVPGAPIRSREGVARFLDAEGRVTVYPAARKDRLEVLAYLAGRFEPGRAFAEREVNEVLRRHHAFEDWALLRRELFDEGFLDRDRNGERYRRVLPIPTR